ncbi:MAG: hypothetical protein KAY71_04505 [Chromatiaceae bacterium]|nr:hypothetical protein [Chromatiaceae bacterium]
MQQTQPLAWGARVTPAFRARLFTLCDDFDWPEARASELMAVMAFETGRTFSPSIRNPLSTATGLIQFMRATAKYLGTSTTALARLSAEGQLYYVQRYLQPFAPRIRDLDDLYMAVLWPAAIGYSGDTLLWRSGKPIFAANRGLDLDRNGRITKKEACRRVHEHLAEGYRMDNVWREPRATP